MSSGFQSNGFQSNGFQISRSAVEVPPETPPEIPTITQAGGIVKYKHHAEDDNRTALMQYQRKRLEQQIEDEEILAVIIAISQRTLH